ncbi:MAG: hypothetical protein ABIR52_07055 [Casimicrobiaceae bacterium]
MNRPATAATGSERKTRRTLLVILAVGLAPVIASYAFYYFAPRDAGANYGELLPTRPVPDVAGTTVDGTPFRLADLRGRWVMLAAAPGACGADCARKLYATRQGRTMQGREQERVVRVWLVTDAVVPTAALLAEQPGLVVVRVDPATATALTGGGARITLIDPLGNQVLAWPADPDIKGLARDLGRVLKASQIG